MGVDMQGPEWPQCRIGQYEENEKVEPAADLASRIFSTVYMGTTNSSQETQQRAQHLAFEIGATHLDTKIDSIVTTMVALFHTITGVPHGPCVVQAAAQLRAS